tara:strand:- start:11485 stop:13605 length:2121 start_codon:yes stop_codon:yes gene_type:complete
MQVYSHTCHAAAHADDQDRCASSLGTAIRQLLIACFLFSTLSVAWAEEEAANVLTFPSQFFTDAQANTAFDMVQLLPGFTFDAGDDDVRGYSAAAGNVLIDAQRPASKFDSLEDILKRIPASAVASIELIRGNSSGINMQGQMQVANIVRHDSTGTEIGAEFALYFHGDHRRLPAAKVDFAHRWREKLLELSFESYKLADDDSGQGIRQRRNTGGLVTHYAESNLVAADEVLQVTLGYEQPASSGELRLNAALESGTKREDENLQVRLPTMEFATITERENYEQLELGARFTRALYGQSSLELLAIQQLRKMDSVEIERNENSSAIFRDNSESGESILRATVRNPLSSSTVFEWGVETAYNFLHSHFLSEEDGLSIALPEADVHVREYRAESFASIVWDLSPRLNTEFGLAYEFSRLSQRSDSSTTRSLGFPKPHIGLSWTPSSASQVQIRLQRVVGQLEFDDFVSSAELATDTLDIGNPELEPETMWELSANWEHRLWRETTVVVGVRHARIDNVVDRVPIFADTDNDGTDELFEGPGNLGRGSVNELSLGLDLPLSSLGISGGDIKGDITWRHTSVIDPLTGEKRQITGTKQPWEGRLEFAQDIPAYRLRWGIQLVLGEREPEFRLDETRVEIESLRVNAFANYELAPAWTLSLELQNLSSRKKTLRRSLYDDARDSSEIAAVDIQSRTFDPYVVLGLRWQPAR